MKLTKPVSNVAYDREGKKASRANAVGSLYLKWLFKKRSKFLYRTSALPTLFTVKELGGTAQVLIKTRMAPNSFKFIPV